MGKDKSESEIREKKEKKEKKRKHEEVEDADASKSKKDKKDKKRKSVGGADVAVDADGDVIIDAAPVAAVKVEQEDGEKKIVVKTDVTILAQAVPFANPLCDDKSQKKVLKSVKKAAKHKTLKRGVKECVKAIRKSPLGTPATLGTDALPNGIVVLAADISPMDVISHIPVLCEDHNIPYVYVPSRAELGAAGSTKRPTSVVMVAPSKANAKAKEGVSEEERKEWEETYRDLHKLAVKLGQSVKV